MHSQKNSKILLIGCGNLGRALLSSWVKNKVLNQSIVVQPSLSSQELFKDASEITFVPSLKSIPKNFKPDIVVLAIKPQQAKTVLPEYLTFIKNSLLVSLLASKQINDLGAYLGGYSKIVRIMPNVALQIDKSVNLVYASDQVLQKERDKITELFNITGKLLWLEKEEKLDNLTPILGSGPAYFFLLAEVLKRSLVSSGIREGLAQDYIKQILLSSALLCNPTTTFEQMIQTVASKGGITEAALEILRPNFIDSMNKALEAALARNQALKNLI